MNLAEEEKEIQKLSSWIDHVKKSLREEKAQLAEAETTLLRTQDAREILQIIAQAVQQKAHQRISGVVSSCLKSVFGDEAYTFKIEFEKKRGKTEARLRFLRGELDADPLTACGGGMVDVAAFALRVSCLVLHRPRLSQIVILDEPFRFVSAQYQDNVRSMLEELSRDMKIQIIQVTHIDNIAAGKIIQL